VSATAWAATGMHHAGDASSPSVFEWAVVAAAALVLLWALGLAIRYTVHPGEADVTHIKHRILLDETDPTGEARER
jgi:hypothetical protein